MKGKSADLSSVRTITPTYAAADSILCESFIPLRLELTHSTWDLALFGSVALAELHFTTAKGWIRKIPPFYSSPLRKTFSFTDEGWTCQTRSCCEKKVGGGLRHYFVYFKLLPASRDVTAVVRRSPTIPGSPRLKVSLSQTWFHSQSTATR